MPKIINGKTFAAATEATVQTLSRDHGISVVFAGHATEANTTGSTVVLPVPKEEMTQTDVLVGRGFADHETGHNLVTDFGYGSRAMGKCKAPKLAKAFANCLEDVRLEHAISTLYPGARQGFETVSDFVNRKTQVTLKEALASHEATPGASEWDLRKRLLPVAITWAGRSKMGYGGGTNEANLALLPPDIAKAANDLADQALATRTGVESAGHLDREAALAGSREIIDLGIRLAEGEIEHHFPPPKGSAAAKEKGDKEEDDKKEDDGGEKGDKEEDDKKEDDRSEGDGDGDGDEPPPGEMSDTRVAKESAPYTPGDIDDALDGDVRMVIDEYAAPADGYAPLTVSFDRWYGKGRGLTTPHRIPFGTNGQLGQYQETLNKIRGHLAVMRRRLERSLLAMNQSDYLTRQAGGKLDTKRLPDAFRGVDSVYRRRVDAIDHDTALLILIDLSGSMGGSKTEMTLRAAILVNEALRDSPVSLAIYGFSAHQYFLTEAETSRCHEIIRRAKAWRGGAYREEALNTVVFKGWGDAPGRAKATIGSIPNAIGGNNVDGESVLLAYHDLLRRPERRKILMVLSDGSPEAVGGGFIRHLEGVVKKIEREGRAELLGFGICSGAVRRYYSRHVVADDTHDMPDKLIDLLNLVLIGKHIKAA